MGHLGHRRGLGLSRPGLTGARGVGLDTTGRRFFLTALLTNTTRRRSAVKSPDLSTCDLGGDPYPNRDNR
jgi:hypothetical protein